jgi:hypothetical protein
MDVGPAEIFWEIGGLGDGERDSFTNPPTLLKSFKEFKKRRQKGSVVGKKEMIRSLDDSQGLRLLEILKPFLQEMERAELILASHNNQFLFKASFKE